MPRLTIALLGVLLVLPQETPPPKRTDRCAEPIPHVRVMQYNIHSGRDWRGRLDLERTASVIERADADVVALQEVDVHWSERSAWRDQVRVLASALGSRAFFAPVYSLPPNREGAPERRFGLAVLSERPVIATINHPMSRLSTQHPSESPVTLPGFPEVVVDVAGTPLHVYAAHLDHRKEPGTRRIQAREIVATLARDPPGHPQVLLGDLNAASRAPELAPLWTRLRDVAGHRGAATYPARHPAVRLDHIAVSAGIGVNGSGVVSSTASDHLPVTADLTVGPTGRTPPARCAGAGGTAAKQRG
ncbi:endonuclease/exonuclease/phosphatase family protein [Actinopolyspora erythraea]|uniref:endonuclease/exonuclease/phosphatase family protein n=1 Tax=Actinopolyspora erythraea TaxID=414996 RepID=UPI000693F833|nr:endonuclease/exonuclease/phosphatase family protein [Actinopolyspora erythraea]